LIIFFSAISVINAQDLPALSAHNYPELNLNCNYSENFSRAFSDSNQMTHHSEGNVFGQAFLGPIIGMGFSFLPGLLLYTGAGDEPVDQIGIGSIFISSYLLGAAAGVYWIAKAENPEVSYWGTAAFSALGGGAGALLAWALAENYHTFPGYGFILVGLCPALGSILYTTLIADWPGDNLNSCLHRNKYAYKNLVTRTELFKIELLRIRL